ncbi:MAG: caspase family protein [Alphaproteobacteria bacterium]|nr:caspase family protein [Alphaproteobacteria bacterium]
MALLRRLGFALLALIATVCAIPAASGPVRAQPASPAEGPRVALVIGNGAYTAAEPLQNPPRDARAMHESLRRMGFDSELVIDADRAAMERAVRRLGERSRGASAAVLFYAGHAIEVAGRNMLIPTSARIREERDIPFEAVDLDAVVAQLDGQARTTILFLDACRNNPFRELLRATGATRSIGAGGLAAVQAPTGMMVSFAADRGQVALDGAGQNSPFTTALLRHIETPGVDVRLMLDEVRQEVLRSTGNRQRPREDVALLPGGFAFKPVAPPPAPAVAQAAPRAAAAAAPIAPIAPAAPALGDERSARDRLVWQAIQTSTNAADYQAYLQEFPDGIFAGLARSRIAQFQVASRGVIRPEQLAPAPRAAPTPAPAPAAAVPAAAEIAPIPVPPAPRPVAAPRQEPTVPAPPAAVPQPAPRERPQRAQRRQQEEGEQQVAVVRPAPRQRAQPAAPPAVALPAGAGRVLDLSRRQVPLLPGNWREVGRVVQQAGWGNIPIEQILMAYETGGRVLGLMAIAVSNNVSLPLMRWPIPAFCYRRDAPLHRVRASVDRVQDCLVLDILRPRGAIALEPWREFVERVSAGLPARMIASMHRIVDEGDAVTVLYLIAPELAGLAIGEGDGAGNQAVAERLTAWAERNHRQVRAGFSRDISAGLTRP